MNIQKLFSALSLATLLLFGLSYMASLMDSGSTQEVSYPLSLAKRYSEHAQNWLEVNQQQNFSASNIDSIVIQTTATDIQIEASLLSEVNLRLSGRYLPKQDGSERVLQAEIRGSVLWIHADESGRSQAASFSDDANHGTLTVELPRTIQNLKLISEGGKLSANKLVVHDLELQTVSGAIDFQNLQAFRSRYRTSSGEVALSGTIDQLVGESVSSEIEISLDNPKPSIDLRSQTGDLEIELRHKPDARLTFKTKNGSLKIDASVGDLKTFEVSGPYDGKLGLGSGSIQIQSESGTTLITGERTP